MKRSHKFLPFTILAAVGLCAIVYWSVRTTLEASATEDASRTHAAAPLDRPAPPKPAEAPALPAPPRVVHPARPEAPDPRDPVVGDPRTDLEARAEAQRKHREYIAGVDASFRREAADPAWSQATASTIQAALTADKELHSLARGVECRARTCRVEIADDGSGALGKLVPRFAQQVGQELPRTVADRVETPRGPAMVVYLFRRDDAQAMTP